MDKKELTLSLFSYEDRVQLENMKKFTTDILLKSFAAKLSPYHKIVIAGGVFTSILNKEQPKDIDIFILCGPMEHLFRAKEDELIRAAQAKNYILEKKDTSYIKNPNIWAVLNDTFSCQKIQYIFSKFETREDLLNDFDFKHTMISYVYGQGIFTTYNSFKAAKEKRLIENRNRKLPIQQWRVEKFLNRGFVTENDPKLQISGKSPPFERI